MWWLYRFRLNWILEQFRQCGIYFFSLHFTSHVYNTSAVPRKTAPCLDYICFHTSFQ